MLNTDYSINDHLLSDEGFKITKINQLKDLVEKVDNMHKQMGSLGRGNKTI